MNKTQKVELKPSSEGTYELTLSLEGLPEDRGEVRLGDLAYELQALNTLLLGLDRAASPNHKVSTEYRIVDLRRINPSQVIVGGTPKEGAPDVRAIVFGQPFETLQRITTGETTGFDYDLLEDIRQISEPVGKRLNRASLKWNGHEFELTPGLRKTIDNLLEPQIISAGFIRGRLEAINVHRSANVFKLYPRVGPQKITGHFPESLREQVGLALGENVMVRGKLKYRANEPHAYAIDAESIEIFPEAVASFYDLLGVAPDLTGELSTEDWLARRRAEIEPGLRKLFGL